MRFGLSSVLGLTLAFVAGLTSFAKAAPVAVNVEMTSLRAIQTANLEKTADDDVYILVTGAAKGQAIDARYPQGKTWPASPKKLAVEKEPLSLWKGELAEGEFVLVTVTVMQGKATGASEAKIKEYTGKIAATEKGAVAAKTLASADDFKKLAASVLESERKEIAKIKEVFSRDKKTDHYGGLFNVLIWNDKGKIVKRLDPVGLTFGEHYGSKEKIYTKLKNTLANVPIPENGEYSLQSLSPMSDDQTLIRAKMLETEYIKTPEREVRNTTDYIAEMRVTAGGKAVKWSLPDDAEQSSLGANITRVDDDIHRFWDWAD